MHHQVSGASSHPARDDIGNIPPPSRPCQKPSAARTHGVKGRHGGAPAPPPARSLAVWGHRGSTGPTGPPQGPQQEVFPVATLHRPAPPHRPYLPYAPHIPRTPPFPRVTPTRTRPAPRVPPDRTLARDLALPLGAVGAALLVTALMLSGGTAHAPVALALFALLTVAVSLLARPVLLPAVVLVSWMFYDGFVLNQRSDLAFQPQDRTGLLVLLLAGVAGAGCAAAVRAVRRHPAR